VSNGATETVEAKLDARAAFRYPAFVNYQFARFCIVVATEMQAVAVAGKSTKSPNVPSIWVW
jgi:hypothetical protein